MSGYGTYEAIWHEARVARLEARFGGNWSYDPERQEYVQTSTGRRAAMALYVEDRKRSRVLCWTDTGEPALPTLPLAFGGRGWQRK